MPTPWPHPRPVSTMPFVPPARAYQWDGIVVGRPDPERLSVGYRAGIKQGAHSLTAASNLEVSIVREVPPPSTTIDPPDLRTEAIGVPAGQRSPALRNLARSANGIGTRQCDVGDAPSSRSITGRRYGNGSL